MAGYANKYTAANTAAFQQRVQMALTRHVHFTLGNGTPTQQQTNLCRAILADKSGWALKFSFSIASEPSLATKLDAVSDGSTTTDVEIESAMQSVFPHYLG